MDSEKRRMVERELQKLQERHRFNRVLMERSLGNIPAGMERHDSEMEDSPAIRECDIRFLSAFFRISCEEIMEVIREDGIERQI